MAGKVFKSVHLTNYYHQNSGGISTTYNHLLEAANRHRRFVRLIVPGEVEFIREIGEFGKIYYVQAEPFPFFDKRYRVLLPQKYCPNESSVRKILSREMPDMIEICDKYSISLLAGLIRKGFQSELKRPMLVHLSCERMDDNIAAYLTKRKIGNWFARRIMSHYNLAMFDFYTANSSYTANEILDSILSVNNQRRNEFLFNFRLNYFKTPRVPINERIFINPCGVDDKIFTDQRRSKQNQEKLLGLAGFPHKAQVLFYAGRISPEKNIQILPEIMQILTKDEKIDFRLLIAGDGPQKDWLENLLKKLAPNKYKLLGHLTDKEELADLYANVNFFIHPNPCEPFGIGPLEAMASGTPVIAPNSGGVLMYAHQNNSWLVEPNAETFAAAVKEIIRLEPEKNKKIQEGLKTAKNFTWKIATDKIFANYDRMFSLFQSQYDQYVYSPQNTDDYKLSKIICEINHI